jgi:hypothetical protein
MRIAHDIRNPLAAIQAVCDTLILETDDPEQLHRLRLINRQVAQLATMLAGAVDATCDDDDAPEIIDLPRPRPVPGQPASVPDPRQPACSISI